MHKVYTFFFLTDTHLGNDGTGWGHHPLRPDLLTRIMPALNDCLDDHSAAFVLHGGDMIDNGLKSQRDEARKLWQQLRTPLHLCLGNHDLAERESYADWLSEWPDVFAGDRADYLITCGPADVYVLANVWPGEEGRPSRWWNREYPSQPGILDEQLEWLDTTLSTRSRRPAILVTHAALDPLPADLTGFDEPTHVPPETFAQPLGDLLTRHRNIRLVLSGHCHATCLTQHGPRVHVTLSAFCEPPFQVRRVSITPRGIAVDTLCPADHHSLAPQWNPNNLWSAGRSFDLKADIAF